MYGYTKYPITLQSKRSKMLVKHISDSSRGWLINHVSKAEENPSRLFTTIM
ncbi:Transposase, IS605 OrfB [Bacillus cereus Rock1-3]|nr:Transposase, IS605 OrfB [Bacillus cereus Rock1-3]EEL37036.1 Transposase, IS605 OrfB [Bacillus cereus Rock3-29]